MIYAQHTSVPVERSRAEIEGILRRFGADQFVSGWDSHAAMIGFRCHNRAVRFVLPLADPQDKRFATPADRLHPVEKPATLLADLIETTTERGALVLDAWSGSGTTGLACKDLGRRCLMIEIEEKYCEIAAQRLRQEVLF